MVLTDLPFERSPLIHSRYSLIQRPGSAPNLSKEDEDKSHSKAYAAFLREQDRKVGPEGFLDSGRYTHSYMLKKKDKGRSSYDGSRPSVVSLSSRIERDKKDYNKKVKVIEYVHCIDIVGCALNKKRLAEEKKLNQGLQKYTKLRQEHAHWKEDEEQHKLQQELAELAIALNMESQKARQQKFDAHRDYKKDSSNKINDDLNAVRDVENKLMKSDGDAKAAELNKRKLSADLALTKSHLAIKQRDGK
ncbi:hypothetical protein KUTeg_003940 [Tegillarca granosa]|uniref:Uncharacterized protein n=1 Tax=Tegillarca granosa TaxID=220873 RepID=A0ABQ9FNJ4_TEGGR|nr:hypothetical protein KUTeg_003940 [Tegillarca granosa]